MTNTFDLCIPLPNLHSFLVSPEDSLGKIAAEPDQNSFIQTFYEVSGLAVLQGVDAKCEVVLTWHKDWETGGR